MKGRKEKGEKLLELANVLLGLELLYDLFNIALSVDRKTSPQTKSEAKFKCTVFHQTKPHRLRKDKTSLLVEFCRDRSAEEEARHRVYSHFFPHSNIENQTPQPLFGKTRANLPFLTEC